MKIEVEASALESIKAMCERLQAERDELLETLQSALETAEFERHANRPWHYDARVIIAKCTQEQS